MRFLFSWHSRSGWPSHLHRTREPERPRYVSVWLQGFKEEVGWLPVLRMTNFTGPVKFKSEAWTKSKVKESSENCISFYFQVNLKVIKPKQPCIQMSPSKNDQIERIWKFLKEQIKGILANRPFLGWGLKKCRLQCKIKSSVHSSNQR